MESFIRMSSISKLEVIFQRIERTFMVKRLLLVNFLVVCVSLTFSKTFHDAPNVDLQQLFKVAHANYIISNHHHFKDTLRLPEKCKLLFDGGSLSGPIIFNETELKGKVNLKGSSLMGHVRNKKFNASWLCNMDGETDDASNINDMIQVCGHVFFPSGDYRLISVYNPEGKVAKKLHRSVKTHIGICRDNVTLEGEDNARFVTKDSLGTICIFSKPYDLENSVCNIIIKGLTFKVENDGKHFYEFFHTIKTIGVNGLVIGNCTFDDFWGDAICLSHYGDNSKTGERTRNLNVRIENNTIAGGDHHNNRNGISVISGKNVIIKDNIIRNTTRKGMPGGIDVEPNNRVYTIDNILIDRNLIENVKTSALSIAIFKNASAHNIKLTSNTIKKCGIGIKVSIKTNNTTDSIIIRNNFIDSDTRPYSFRGEGGARDWIITDNYFGKPCLQEIPGGITVNNLVVKNNKKKVL